MDISEDCLHFWEFPLTGPHPNTYISQFALLKIFERADRRQGEEKAKNEEAKKGHVLRDSFIAEDVLPWLRESTCVRGNRLRP